MANDATTTNSPKILGAVEVKPYFKDGDFVLYNGDSISLLSQIPENSIETYESEFRP